MVGVWLCVRLNRDIANGNGVVGSFRVADLDDRLHPPHLFAPGQLDGRADHAPAIAATNESVWVGYGTTIVELNATDLSERQRFTVDEAALSLVATPTGLFAISESAITQLDAHGAVVRRLAVSIDSPVRAIEVS